MIIKTIKFQPPVTEKINFNQFDSKDCIVTYEKYGKVGFIQISEKSNIITFDTVIKDKIPFDIKSCEAYIELDYCDKLFKKKYFTTQKSNKNGFCVTKKEILKIFNKETDFGLVLNLCRGDKIIDYVKFNCKCVNIENGK